MAGKGIFYEGKYFSRPLFLQNHIFSNAFAMTKLIRFISPLLLLSFLILLFACGKEASGPTVINGKVTDKKSGLPIEGAVINIDFQQLSGLIVTNHEYKQFATDQQGEFHYTHNSDYDGTYSDVGKGGYVTQGKRMNIEQCFRIISIRLLERKHNGNRKFVGRSFGSFE